jgi:hypothetical protein
MNIVYIIIFTLSVSKKSKRKFSKSIDLQQRKCYTIVTVKKGS